MYILHRYEILNLSIPWILWDSLELLKLISQREAKWELSGREHSFAVNVVSSGVRFSPEMSALQTSEEQGSTSAEGSKQEKEVMPPEGVPSSTETEALLQ